MHQGFQGLHPHVQLVLLIKFWDCCVLTCGWFVARVDFGWKEDQVWRASDLVWVLTQVLVCYWVFGWLATEPDSDYCCWCTSFGRFQNSFLCSSHRFLLPLQTYPSCVHLGAFVLAVYSAWTLSLLDHSWLPQHSCQLSSGILPFRRVFLPNLSSSPSLIFFISFIAFLNFWNLFIHCLSPTLRCPIDYVHFGSCLNTAWNIIGMQHMFAEWMSTWLS